MSENELSLDKTPIFRDIYCFSNVFLYFSTYFVKFNIVRINIHRITSLEIFTP